MRKRFFRSAVLSIAAGLLIAFLFAVPLMEQIYIDEAEDTLSNVMALADVYLENGTDYQGTAQALGRRLEQAGSELRITIIAADGTVLGDSQEEPAAMENHARRPEVEKALAGGEGQDIRKSATLGMRQMYLAQSRTMSDGRVLVLRASVPLRGFGQVQFMLWCCAGIGIFLGLIVALFSAHYAAGRMMEPVHSLIKAVRSISDGDVTVRVADAPDEMGELSGAFNKMSERLAAAQEKLEQSNSQLAGILQGMDDGVVALDAEGRITLMTHRARELLGECPATARRLSECGSSYLHIQSLMDDAAEKRGAVRDTLLLAGPPERILQVYAAPIIDGGGGALAVVADVTRIRKLESMRSEFVANVTHELKTPLTSIRGYVELLKSAPRDPETAQSFYEIIEIEAERLQKLTDDLLQLSEIESARPEGDPPPVLLGEITEKIAASLLPEAEARGIVIHQYMDEVRVKADPRRIYQMLKNLMENAVKYNRDGGVVNVSAGLERGVAVIRVHDTGIGIPTEHLGRIFERFYRVDKGRSRERGGTGLGLSIVKHIVSLYGGDVRADSEPGVGTTFTVRLPAAEPEKE